MGITAGSMVDYVRADAKGVLRVAGTPISLDSVVIAFNQGESAESIRQAYPVLTLEMVYGAITYYLANRDEVGAYLARQHAVWESERSDSEIANVSVLARLRHLKRSAADAMAPSGGDQ
jgi:uncharacterized protein (DUF433 family)